MCKTKVIAGILIVIAFVGLPISVQAQSDDELVAEWHFDEGAGSVLVDSSGNGNDGVIYGATWVEGKYGGALEFDGVDDYVEITPQSDVSAIGDFAISAWTYLEDWKSQTSSDKDRQYVFDGHSHSKTVTNDFSRPGFCLIYDGNSHIEEIHNFIMYSGKECVELNTQIGLKVKWIHHVFMRKGNIDYTYINGQLISANYVCGRDVKSNELLNMQHNWFIGTFSGNNANYNSGVFNYGFYGIIDEMQIYNRALTADEIKELYEGKQTALTITKSSSPHSIRQFSETTITLSIENTGTTDVTDIEITDAIHPSFYLTGGNFPNPKRYDLIRPGETRDLQYTISAKESGTFMLDLAIVTYADKDGNIQETLSEPASIKVIPSTEGSNNDTLHSTPPESEGVSTPGFTCIVAVVGLLLAYVRRRL